MAVPLCDENQVPASGKAVDILAVFPGSQGNVPTTGNSSSCVHETSTDSLILSCNENFLKHCQIVVKMWSFKHLSQERCRFIKSKYFNSTDHWADLLVSVYNVKDVCCSTSYCNPDVNVFSSVISVYVDSIHHLYTILIRVQTLCLPLGLGL